MVAEDYRINTGKELIVYSETIVCTVPLVLDNQKDSKPFSADREMLNRLNQMQVERPEDYV